MNKLPTEISNQIFLLLQQQDKVECMCVCRHWENTIKSLSLFHTVRATSINALRKTIQKIQDNPYQGTKVERLILHFQYVDIDLTKLLTLLPNLRVLSLLECESNIVTDEAPVHYPWHKYIEYILESSSSSIPLQLLESNICPRLTSLSISIKNKNIISLLKNAPVLKNLVIGFDIIGLNDLEQIHTNAPRLESIKVISMLLNDFDSVNEIKPAPLISNCILDDIPVTSIETETVLLYYISKKYPNLTKFTYNVEYAHMSDNDRTALYKYGWNPLFQALGPFLKELGIGQAARIMNLFEILDTYGAQLTFLTLRSKSPTLDNLARSNQTRSLQTLKLCIDQDTTFNWLEGGFMSLETLKLSSGAKPVTLRLDRLLDSVPATLKALSLRRVELVVPEMYTPPFSLTSLSLVLVTLPKTLDHFITQSKLSRLEFKHCNLRGRSLHLPSTRLSYLRILETFPYESRFISVSTSSEERLYTSKSFGLDLWKFGPELRPLEERSTFGAPAFPASKSVPANEIQTTPFFTLVCHSLKDVFILDAE
ncbi:hypothetical protein K501DRAFT_274593 [Backusella circina FSU 941]|nr:hypothetical protein K501DRAFT_274593 [Backusella circina FSU 941]